MMFGEISLEPLFHESGIPLAIMGMLVVFVALTILVLVISALPRVIAFAERKHSQEETTQSSDAASVSKEAGGEPVPSLLNHSHTASPPVDFAAASSAAATSAAASSVAGDELTPELIAVIAAAAAEYELGPVRVVRMRPLTPSELAWTLEGRLRHHASHRLQPRNR
ncbi:Oxaloacetate decarboxylase, gamma chain [Rubripirellula obstinata]|uniref:Oxaloacetate decarboxylase, gamma chain n=1 Tax=Rubripirellula obstinata TaxID=406547 RepID=A0A5B1CSH8_9BACT|nr:OadG family protein [Rubripirellula obstinata]KAA1262353.1 Oxaloacetate decarboxylase, gamma chain [Rubripirellula obstinata]